MGSDGTKMVTLFFYVFLFAGFRLQNMLRPNLVCQFLQFCGYTFGFKSNIFDEETCEAGNEEVYGDL